MQITTNEKLIKRRSRLGTYASLAGLAVLVVGMIASFRPQYLWISLIAILLGFVLAQYGSYSIRRWGRSPRPDQVIAAALKGFDDRYHFYAWELPSAYVLLSPQGVYSFTARDQTGKVTVNGSKWKSKLSVGRVLMMFASEGLGNPTSEAMDTAGKLTNWMRSKLPDASLTAQPVIVFIDPRAELEVTEPTVPVVDAKGLKKWLRGAGKGDNLKSVDYKALEDLFNAKTARVEVERKEAE